MGEMVPLALSVLMKSVGLVLAFALAGCAAFGPREPMVSLPLADLERLEQAIEARYFEVVIRVAQLCATRTLGPEDCARARQLHQEVLAGRRSLAGSLIRREPVDVRGWERLLGALGRLWPLFLGAP